MRALHITKFLSRQKGFFVLVDQAHELNIWVYLSPRAGS